VSREETAEYIPFPPVQEASSQHVAVQEPQHGPERQPPREYAEAAPPRGLGADAGIGPPLVASQLHLGLPVRVAVVLLHPGVDVGIGMMQHVVPKAGGPAVKNDVFVDLVIARPGITREDLLVSSEAVPEEAQVPARVVAAMADPSPQEYETTIDEVAVRPRMGDLLADRRGGVWPDPT